MSIWLVLAYLLSVITLTACVLIGWLSWQIGGMSEWTDWEPADLGAEI